MYPPMINSAGVMNPGFEWCLGAGAQATVEVSYMAKSVICPRPDWEAEFAGQINGAQTSLV